MHYKREPGWTIGRSFFKNAAPQYLQSWLIDRESLTQRIICACNLSQEQTQKKSQASLDEKQNGFRVSVFHQAWQKPEPSEAKLLGMKQNELGFVRQVHLYCGNVPWVYAKTVIPRSTLHGELQKLTNLGAQSLGSVLFANRHISRDAIEIAKLTRNHAMFDVATNKSSTTTESIWGRRSVFRIGEKPLLVSEIFLPDLPNSMISGQ